MSKDKKIVVVASGWVFIGNVNEEEDSVVIKSAENIRKWGTARGLGEVALKGMPSGAEVDQYGTVRVPKGQVLFTIDCEV